MKKADYKIEPINMTKNNYESLIEDIKKYEVKRAEILKSLSEGNEFGDIKTSGETYLKHELELINSFIEYDRNRLSRANIVEDILDENAVDYSCYVHTVVNDGTSVYNEIFHLYEAKDCETILSHDDDDATYVSLSSPIGRAIYGKKIGDKVNVKLPNGNLLEIIIADLEKELTR